MAGFCGTNQPQAQATTTSLAPSQVLIRDYLTAALTKAKIKLLDMESSLKDKQLTIYVASLNKQQSNQAAAYFAMGILVQSIAKSSDPNSRPQTLIVLYDAPETKKIRRMTLTEPTLSQLLSGKITEDEAGKMIRIEESAE